MKRCKSDDLQQQQGEEDGAGLEDAACHLLGADLRPGEATGANSAGGPTSDVGAAAAPNPGPRSKPPDLKVSADPPLASPVMHLAFPALRRSALLGDARQRSERMFGQSTGRDLRYHLCLSIFQLHSRPLCLFLIIQQTF